MPAIVPHLVGSVLSRLVLHVNVFVLYCNVLCLERRLSLRRCVFSQLHVRVFRVCFVRMPGYVVLRIPNIR